MAIVDEKIIKDVKNQFKISDLQYKLNVENITIEEVLALDNEERMSILKSWGEIMETYLKGLLRWKGTDWGELKSKKHDLKAAYDALDEVGKELFKNFMKIKSSELPKDLKKLDKVIESKAYVMDEDLKGMYIQPENLVYHHDKYDYAPMIQNLSYENGQYDGEAILGALSGKKKYSIETFCNMLSMIKVADFRYANAKAPKFNDDFMRTMYDAVRSIHALTILARGEKKHSI